MGLSVVILGASGYTGGELVRLLALHPRFTIKDLTAERHAGYEMRDIFPNLAPLQNLPKLISLKELSFAGVDCVFCALPHATTQNFIKSAFQKYSALKIVDLSADFRLSDPNIYENCYGTPHKAVDLQQEAVYGLSEYFHAEIKKARLVANPGCYPTSVLLALMPLMDCGLIEENNIIIDAKSGVSGAGRSEKRHLMHAEMSESFSAYALATHRHAPEIDEMLSKAYGKPVIARFTPHLLPINRGILSTIYLDMPSGKNSDDLRDRLQKFYSKAPFVKVLEAGKIPSTSDVRGSNHCRIAVFPDRIEGKAIIVSVIDNLLKGASSQAVQNMNLMMGFEEIEGLNATASFP